ncbi:MAG: response regulator transcription factor [Deltaproteobacteria bacterium]|jgi:two-component system phosphate regulon response regulator OmpR|nr:response regulator transcription factor [Deltaproteobacteria bacterium]
MTISQDVEAKIMIVDDAVRLRTRLEDFLLSHRFATESIPDGRGALETLERFKPDLILLDVMLPGEDGFAVLRRIRRVSAVPVIMLTAANNRTDRVKGLDQGADDYIGKPFSLGELLARVRAVLRRARPLAPDRGPAAAGEPADSLATGPLTLEISRHRLTFLGNGQEAHKNLSLLEFRLFYLFMANVGQILSRDQILEHIFDDKALVETHSLNVYVNRLRKILAELGADPKTLATVWGYGYSWKPAEAERPGP